MSPVQRAALVEPRAVEQGEMHLDDAAQRALCTEPLDCLAQAEIERSRHELCDEVRMGEIERQHRFRLGGIGRHPRLAQDVLACLECGPGVLQVHVWPGADADGVDGRVGEQFLH